MKNYKSINLTFLLLGLIIFSTGLLAGNIKASLQTPESIKNALSNNNNLILSTGIFDPLHETLDFAETQINSISSQRYGIIQFEDKKADFHWLQKKGFKVIQNLPHNAFLVNWLNSDKSALDANSNIRWSGAFQSGYKVSPDLWTVNRSTFAKHQLSIHTFKDAKNFQLKGFIQKYLPGVKAVKSNIPADFNHYVIEVNASSMMKILNTLAANEDIQWIATFHPQKFFNTEAVSATQATSLSGGNSNDDNYIPNTTPIWDQGLFGSGQIVGIADSGLDRNEDWFMHLDKGAGVVTAITDAEAVTFPTVGTLHPDNKVIAYWTMPGALDYDIGTFHGTHTSGSIAGDRILSIGVGPAGSISSPLSHGYDNDDGMAPNAQILFNDLGGPIGNTGFVSLSGTGSTPMWQQAFAGGASIHSNSYGSSSAGAYGGSDQRADETLRELDDMIILFAAGNGGGANTIFSPGVAKNVTTVGYLQHGNLSIVNNLSNRGPTDDGRLKPDISATGSLIESAGGDNNNTSVDSNPARASKSGTSMATPITAGSTALLRQYFTDGFYPTGVSNSVDDHTPSGSLMKAVLLNGTNTDGGFFANDIGWGRVWLENSLYFDGEAKKMRIWEITNTDGLLTGEQFSVDVAIQAGEEFRATLVWYDLAGPTGSGITLVNDLNLTVQLGANTYFGNNFSANNSVTTGTADALNTVEQVRFSAPVSGSYSISVDASAIPGNGTYGSDKQGFALVVSGDLSSGGAIPTNPTDPSGLTATANGLTGIDLAWSDVSVDYDSYEIYRTVGSCATADLTTLRYIGNSSTNSFLDANSVGGFQYSYKVRAFSDDLISDYTNCIDVVSAQACLIPPIFDQGTVVVAANTGATCQVELAWDAATSSCTTTSDLQYNIYRSTSHDFIPDGSNLIATSALNANSFTDLTAVSGQPYYYVVKSEDTTTMGTGPNNGNESIEVTEIATTAIGASTLEGNMVDDVDNLTLMQLSGIWSISADQASNGSLSYRSAIEGSSTYTANTCARMYSTTFEIPATPANPADITYQARYNVEADWDGVVVEISNDGGATWTDLPPVGGYPNDFSSTGNPPINICGYAASHGAFNGNTANAFQSVSHDLSAYHGDTVQIRWSLSTDPGSEEEGFYVDELNYNNILVPQACSSSVDLIFANGFEN